MSSNSPKPSPLEMFAKWSGMALKSILMAGFYLVSAIGNAMQVFKKDDGDKK
jgi:hypothetical protein